MFRIGLALLFASLLPISCSTGAAIATTGEGSQSTDDFDVDVEQMNAPMLMPGFSAVDVKFEVAVTNRTSRAVTLEHIALQSLGAGTYQIPSRSRPFHKTIAPGAQEKFEFWAAAQVDDPTMGTKAPLTLRTMLTLKDARGKRTESFVRRVNGRVALGITG